MPIKLYKTGQARSGPGFAGSHSVRRGAGGEQSSEWAHEGTSSSLSAPRGRGDQDWCRHSRSFPSSVGLGLPHLFSGRPGLVGRLVRFTQSPRAEPPLQGDLGARDMLSPRVGACASARHAMLRVLGSGTQLLTEAQSGARQDPALDFVTPKRGRIRHWLRSPLWRLPKPSTQSSGLRHRASVPRAPPAEALA